MDEWLARQRGDDREEHSLVAAGKTANKPAAKASGEFAPVAPLATVAATARAAHRRAVAELESDPDQTQRIAVRLAEWLTVQTYRDNAGLTAWAGKTATLYKTAADTAESDPAKAGEALAAAGKAWSEYDKNVKVWSAAAPKAGSHQRVTKGLKAFMSFLREVAAQGSGKADAAVRKGDLAPAIDDLLLLAESGNLLISERDHPLWKANATLLRDAALHLVEVGRRGDRINLKPALTEVQRACNNCHGEFRN